MRFLWLRRWVEGGGGHAWVGKRGGKEGGRVGERGRMGKGWGSCMGE